MQNKMPAGWNIKHNPKPIPNSSHDWDFYHDNFDGENGLAGTAEDYCDAIEQIAEIEAEKEGVV